MRALEVVSSAQWGGTQAQVIQYASELDHRGAEVLIACGEDGAMQRRAAGLGLNTHKLRWLRPSASPRADLLAIDELRSVIAAYQPQIIHTHDSKASAGVRMAVGRTNASARDRPIIVHHCYSLAWGEGQPGGLTGQLRRSIDRASAKLCDGVVSVSRVVNRQLLADRTYPMARHTIIPSGVELGPVSKGPFTAEAEERRLLGLPTSGTLIIHIGRVAKGKGHDLSIAATLALAEAGHAVNLLVVGDGPLMNSFRDQTERSGDLSGHIHYLGFRTDIAAIVRLSDIACLPAQTAGLPLSLIEAMAAGLPVVATAVGAIPELVVSGENGILLPPACSASRLSVALLSLMQDQARARLFGAAGRRRAERHFSAHNTVRGVDFLCEMVGIARTAA